MFHDARSRKRLWQPITGIKRGEMFHALVERKKEKKKNSNGYYIKTTTTTPSASAWGI